MKRLILLICFSLAFSQELKVEGNLNVTGAVINDSLVQVIDSLNNKPKIYVSKGKWKEYKHFKYYLTPYNTILPSFFKNSKQNNYNNNYRDEILDENSLNFSNYGQFEIFIPKDKYQNADSRIENCNKYVIIRMPQTYKSNKNYELYIKQKKELYYRIKNMVESKQGIVEIIIESGDAFCNDFFRTGSGKYINYVGQYNPY